jgi:UDP-2,3-diacylglucosamine pyrophosphatase LpxH
MDSLVEHSDVTSDGGEDTYITSDLHLGSPYSHHDNFLAWLDQVPPDARLILNGDIIDDPRKDLPADHLAVLERLVQESHQRPLVWVYGNHDRSFKRQDLGAIQFASEWEVGDQLMVKHGDSFDGVMPRHSVFKGVFKFLHRLLIKSGFPDVHVAQYAKKWGFLYRVLNEHVTEKAVKVAKAKGFAAITCGHTHAPMDIDHKGVRYLNTGAWTENPHYYLKVDAGGIHFCCFAGIAEAV